MTKQEIRVALEAKGVFHTNKSRDPLWVDAFKMYNASNKQQLNINCGGCWTKVREWLQS